MNLRQRIFRGKSVQHSALLLIVLCVFPACEDRKLGSTERGAAAGGAIGAGLGAIAGNQSGQAGAGALVGAAFGSLSGGLIGNQFDSQDEKLEERARLVREQEASLAENRRLIEELMGTGLEARISPRGVVVKLPEVFFEFDSAKLTADARHTVSEIASVLKGVKGRHISVEGHADSSGDPEYNLNLSKRRARTVAVALVHDGVARKAVSTRGFGENRPVAPDDSEAGRAKNRRVEVVIENRENPPQQN